MVRCPCSCGVAAEGSLGLLPGFVANVLGWQMVGWVLQGVLSCLYNPGVVWDGKDLKIIQFNTAAGRNTFH